MAIDEKIAQIRAAKTTLDDYAGKRIIELEDTVLNSADELKARFDANVEDVLDPAHNALCEATAAAFEERRDERTADLSSINTKLDSKAPKVHSHVLGTNTIEGILPISKGGTGAANAESARAMLQVSKEGHMHTTSSIYGFDEELNKKADAGHTHGLSGADITGTLPVNKGGTGANNAADGLSNLGGAPRVHTHTFGSSALIGTLSVSQGGTGATTKVDALKNLGAADVGHLHALSGMGLTGILPIYKGGTGADNAEEALASLGAASAEHTHTLASLGAAGAAHTHTPSSLGAASAVHSHAQEDITGLADSLNSKASAAHTHEQNDITGLTASLAAKAEEVHSHSLAGAEVTGTLPISKGGTGAASAAEALTSLGAASSGHKHVVSDIEGLVDGGEVSEGMIQEHNVSPEAHQALFNEKASLEHTHAQGDITGLTASLAAKAEAVHSHSLEGDEATGTLPISKGGTGATSASSALTNLGAASVSHTHAQEDITGLPQAMAGLAKIWFATSSGGMTRINIETTTGDFTISEGNMVVVHFTGMTSQGSGSGFVYIDGNGIDIFDIKANENFQIAADTLVLFIVIKPAGKNYCLARFGYGGEV